MTQLLQTNEYHEEQQRIRTMLEERVKSATAIAKEFLRLKMKPMTFINEKREFYGQYLPYLEFKIDQFNTHHLLSSINRFRSLNGDLKSLEALKEKYKKQRNPEKQQQIGDLIVVVSWLNLFPYLIFDERNHAFRMTSGDTEGHWLRDWMNADVEVWSSWIKEYMTESEHYQTFIDDLSQYRHNMQAVNARINGISPVFIFMLHVKGELVPFA